MRTAFRTLTSFGKLTGNCQLRSLTLLAMDGRNSPNTAFPALARRKRTDDATVRDGALLTLAQQVVQLAAQRFQVRNLSVDVGEVIPRHRVHGAAVIVLVIGQTQQRAYLV
jgi:hypothetical protein